MTFHTENRFEPSRPRMYSGPILRDTVDMLIQFRPKLPSQPRVIAINQETENYFSSRRWGQQRARAFAEAWGTPLFQVIRSHPS